MPFSSKILKRKPIFGTSFRLERGQNTLEDIELHKITLSGGGESISFRLAPLAFLLNQVDSLLMIFNQAGGAASNGSAPPLWTLSHKTSFLCLRIPFCGRVVSFKWSQYHDSRPGRRRRLKWVGSSAGPWARDIQVDIAITDGQQTARWKVFYHWMFTFHHNFFSLHPSCTWSFVIIFIKLLLKIIIDWLT